MIGSHYIPLITGKKVFYGTNDGKKYVDGYIGRREIYFYPESEKIIWQGVYHGDFGLLDCEKEHWLYSIKKIKNKDFQKSLFEKGMVHGKKIHKVLLQNGFTEKNFLQKINTHLFSK